jgi:hypothetical protein
VRDAAKDLTEIAEILTRRGTQAKGKISMSLLLSERELAELEPAEKAAFHSPVPTQIVSNGEFLPLRQTSQQRKVEARIKELADTARSNLWLHSNEESQWTSPY